VEAITDAVVNFGLRVVAMAGKEMIAELIRGGATKAFAFGVWGDKWGGIICGKA
jgi:hypothetical protein